MPHYRVRPRKAELRAKADLFVAETANRAVELIRALKDSPDFEYADNLLAQVKSDVDRVLRELID
jgi:hypothetical protein